jgi:hypothetical protein
MLTYRIPDTEIPKEQPMPWKTRSRAHQRSRSRRQETFIKNLGQYQRGPHGCRVALKWHWTTQRCKQCGEVRYTRATLRWSYARRRPDGKWQVISKPVHTLRPGTLVPEPGPAPLIKCTCPGKRGPRPSALGRTDIGGKHIHTTMGLKPGTQLLANGPANH